MQIHRYEIINAIFYQTLEYIVAPLMLVLITHFLKKNKNDNIKGLGDNTIEYTFISLYSNLLFYFSLSSHHDHIIYCLCNRVETALLINCVFVSFLVIVHKDILLSAKFPIVLKKIFDWLWLFVMILIFLLVVVVNLHKQSLSVSLSIEDLIQSFKAFYNYFKYPDHALLLLFMIVVFGITFMAWSNQDRDDFRDYQKTIAPNDISENTKVQDMKEYSKLASSENAKPELKAQSNYYLAVYYSKIADYAKALEYALASKAIAVAIHYPEIQLLPIRRLLISLYKALKNDELARQEIEELKKILANAPDGRKKTIQYCITKLEEEINL